MNIQPLVRAFNHILAHPDEWDQSQWHCGTTHCLFGHCQILAGIPVNSESCLQGVMRLTGLSRDDAEWLADARRTLPEIRAYLDHAIRGVPYFNSNGRDRAGFDRAGFDRDGFDRYGYNRAGYDRAGFDRAGYDCAGYDRNGRDRAGRPVDPL